MYIYFIHFGTHLKCDIYKRGGCPGAGGGFGRLWFIVHLVEPTWLIQLLCKVRFVARVLLTIEICSGGSLSSSRVVFAFLSVAFREALGLFFTLFTPVGGVEARGGSWGLSVSHCILINVNIRSFLLSSFSFYFFFYFYEDTPGFCWTNTWQVIQLTAMAV